MVLIRYFVILGTLIGITTIVTGCDNRPLREECISRIEIDWASDPSANKEKTIRLIVDSIIRAPKKDYNRISPSMASRGESREFIYLQYKFDCKNKEKNTLALIRHAQDFVKVRMTVSKEKFLPGVDTMLSSGEWWSDGNTPEIDGRVK